MVLVDMSADVIEIEQLDSGDVTMCIVAGQLGVLGDFGVSVSPIIPGCSRGEFASLAYISLISSGNP